MKSYRNTKKISGKETMGRRLSMAGLAILFIGLLSSFTPNWYPLDEPASNQFGRMMQQYWTYISFVALPAGFIFASVGSYYINRFARRRWPDSKNIERPDEFLERNMKGFDDKYTYFAYSLPANYVVSGPCGILLFTVRSDKGRVTVNGDTWKEPFSLGRIFTVFAREGVGNPDRELQDQADKIRALLSEASAENAALFSDVPINGAVVFLNSQVELELNSPSLPALRAKQVKDFMRRQTKEVKLPTATARVLSDYLVEKSTYQTD